MYGVCMGHIVDTLKGLHNERLGITFNEEKEKECDAKVDEVTRRICQVYTRSLARSLTSINIPFSLPMHVVNNSY